VLTRVEELLSNFEDTEAAGGSEGWGAGESEDGADDYDSVDELLG
jgi:hypothetical protein